ncbi:MAG: DUF3050 domain-containing protein [Gammaproteobacteria bacterium]
MTSVIDFDALRPLQLRLEQHPVYGAVRTLSDLRCFMQHHVFSVWDFMSLIKYLQHHIAPAAQPWAPAGNTDLRYFINQLVLEEETDEAPPDKDGNPVYLSHFELYCGAMREVGADPEPMLAFLERVRRDGIQTALSDPTVPAAAREFTTATFRFIATDKPHVVASALALGREHIIPNMFRALLKRMGIGEADAPLFHFYLNRHIHLDEDFHAPLSLKMVARLCDGDAVRMGEAQQAAKDALEARIRFWDGVGEALQARAA